MEINNKQPKLTIITVNLNNGEKLGKTIKSVLNQNFHDYEYIIVDGGSKDCSLKIINMYKDKIDRIISERDYGVYSAMNKGIRIAQGKYCMFLNSGDFIYDNSTIKKVFEAEPYEDILYGDSILVNHPSNTFRVKEPDQLTFRWFYEKSICHQAMFIKRELFSEKKYGLYREDFQVVSDWEFNIRVIIYGGCTVKYLPVPIVYYDYQGMSNLNIDLSLREREVVLKELFPERILIDYSEFQRVSEEIIRIKKSKGYRILKRLFKLIGHDLI